VSFVVKYMTSEVALSWLCSPKI